MMQNNSDEEICTKLRDGDKVIFSQLFQQFYSSLCNYANGFVFNEEIAKEVVLDIFLNIWEKRESLNIINSLKAYLYRAVHNQCLNYIKKSHNIRVLQVYSNEDERVKDSLLNKEIPPDVYDKLFTEEVKIQLEKVMKDLPDQSRKIFYLCRFENLSYKEIARELKVSLSTVKTHMARATLKLSAEIRKFI